jgi:branched-chain amino acid transport system permease protein
MVFFAALTCVGVMDKLACRCGSPAAHRGGDDLLGLAIERVVLRPLVNQPEITLFMATIGLAFFIEGLAQLVFGAQVRKLELPIEDVPSQYLMDNYNILVSQFDIMAALVCGLLVPRWPCCSRNQSRPRAARGGRRPPGRAGGRHSAAAHLGRAVGGGGLRGAGGRHAVGRAQWRAVRADLRRAEGAAGADPRRLHLGAGRHRRRPDHRRSEKLAEVYIGPLVGGGIEGWFPYVLALLFLLVRPEGLFGEKIIRRI